jgi:hypothetical protein
MTCILLVRLREESGTERENRPNYLAENYSSSIRNCRFTGRRINVTLALVTYHAFNTGQSP